MKKLVLFCCLLLCSFCYAGGGMTHMFLAKELIATLPDKNLQQLLNDNLEAYLVGAYYPDSGYVVDHSYGEDSHWDPFIYTFADYIKEHYPQQSHPKIMAFLFGCAVHSISDQIMHFEFYNTSKDKDFAGDYNLAHQYGDTGIDLLINIDKNEWLTHPLTWWVPVSDLLQIYHRMGKDDYTREEIIHGNNVIYFLGYGERLISAPAYPYLKMKMPWTAANYYDWPTSGIVDDEKRVSVYLMNLWAYLQDPNAHHVAHTQLHSQKAPPSPLIALANSALTQHIASVRTRENPDGSVEISQPKLLNARKFREMSQHLFQ